MEKAAVSGKGSIQLPFDLREKYRIEDGGLVLLIEREDGLLLQRLDASFFDSFLGKYMDDAPSAEEMAGWAKEEITEDEARLKSLP
jgi:bifunctional DNA-binding transcriptional regulator/antitoxin component of YhaV-PrlF toxin-antitoxin module